MEHVHHDSEHDYRRRDERSSSLSVDRVKEVTREQAAAAKSQIRDAASAGRDQLVERLHTVSRALRGTGERLRSENEGDLSQYAEYASDSVARLAHSIHEREPEDLVDEAESFARARPLLFLGGAFVAGLALGRFMRSGNETPRPSFAEAKSGRFSNTPPNDWAAPPPALRSDRAYAGASSRAASTSESEASRQNPGGHLNASGDAASRGREPGIGSVPPVEGALQGGLAPGAATSSGSPIHLNPRTANGGAAPTSSAAPSRAVGATPTSPTRAVGTPSTRPTGLSTTPDPQSGPRYPNAHSTVTSDPRMSTSTSPRSGGDSSGGSGSAGGGQG